MVSENESLLNKDSEERIGKLVFTLVILGFIFLSGIFLVSAASVPQPPSNINVTANETRGLTPQAGFMLNTSGGYVTTVNLTARSQNTRWKAFVGWVTGRFALDDASGSTIYDWSISSVQGTVYATRNSSVISWATIACANVTNLSREDLAMNHTNAADNITKTFSDTTHASFFVGSTSISANTCPTLNTYVSNASQNTDFEEVALFDGTSVVYASLIESGGAVGFDTNTYDFQMIVPEVGLASWTGATAYYLYVELV